MDLVFLLVLMKNLNHLLGDYQSSNFGKCVYKQQQDSIYCQCMLYQVFWDSCSCDSIYTNSVSYLQYSCLLAYISSLFHHTLQYNNEETNHGMFII